MSSEGETELEGLIGLKHDVYTYEKVIMTPI
jgi:hypothetical protein